MAEHNRSSLVDDSFASVGSGKKSKKSSGSGGNSGMGLKIGLIVVCFIGAALGFAYSQGMFEAPPKPVVRTETDNNAAAESQKIQDAVKTKPNIQTGGS